ncbi:MAG: hypothetical protein HY060_02530 [Proteobacteria bacterium]|nr:hypothetical protein [Pseudomonadota bacterium]
MSWVDRLAAIVPHVPPSPSQVIGVGAVALVAVALAGLGGTIGRRERLPETDLFVGWGVVASAFTLVGTIGPIPFTAIAGLLLVGSVVAYAVRFRQADRAFPAGTGRAVVLAAPLLILAASITASQWDEFTQWLHSARYLFQYDLFPGRGRPASTAIYPAYPYALPLIAYLASRIADRFVEGGVAVFNLLILLAVALLFVRLMRSGLEGRRRALASGDAAEPPPWAMVALALLSVTLLSPSFVPKLVLTSYAETAAAATVAVAGVLGWAALERVSAGEHGDGWRLALRAGLVLAVLVALKESTLALYLVVLGALLLAAWRRADVGWRVAAPLLALAAAPGLVVYAVWRVYVARELPGQEVHMLPLAQWNWGLVPGILGSMAKVGLSKVGHFGLMLVIAGFALRALVRRRGQGRGGIESLALIAAAVMVGYNAFLFFSYLAVFQGWEAERAASYWRYNTHVGLIGVAVAVFGAAVLWRRAALPRLTPPARRALVGVALALTVLAPVALLDRFRFDLEPRKLFARQVGETLSRSLPIESRVIVIDPDDPGFYPLLVNYALDGRGHVVGAISSLTRDPPDALRRLIWEQRATHLLALGPDPTVAAVTEATLPKEAAALLTRERDGQWQVTKSWVVPPSAGRK